MLAPDAELRRAWMIKRRGLRGSRGARCPRYRRGVDDVLLPLGPESPCPFSCSQKWSKGKVKEKLQNQVLFDKITYERCINDVPKQKLITPSIISEKLKVNGSLARKAVKELISKNLIRPVLTHSSQTIYTRATNT